MLRGDILFALLLALPGLGSEAASGGPGSDGSAPLSPGLDVGVRPFDPGLGERPPSRHEATGILATVRMAEARYVSAQLMQTLEREGIWGEVHILPEVGGLADLVVSGKLRESTGSRLTLTLEVVDATGRRWLRRRYREKADADAYLAWKRDTRDPYDELYRRVASDLAAVRERLGDERLTQIATAAEIRFAAELAPEPCAGYLSVDRRGRVRVERLPARDDPIFARIRRIRERDRGFLAALTEHYRDFGAMMEEPYDRYRQGSYQERQALEEARRLDHRRQPRPVDCWAAGGAPDIACADPDRARLDPPTLQMSQKSEQLRRQEEQYLRALVDLAIGFEAEVEPILIEVEGQTLRLRGSVETQYRTWRRLLRKLFAEESGLPLADAGS